MARARRAAAKAEQSPVSASDQSEQTFTCPECGMTFTRAASLGAHRNRAHGVAGVSKARTSGRRRRVSAAANGRRRGAARAQRGSSDGAAAGVNRDALLQALFPNGLPARESVIRAANDWLDQAEQLAKLK
jgi:uncharacterized C2H2 Zn-finger protein